MDESFQAYTIWFIERGLVYPPATAQLFRVAWVAKSPLTPQEELLLGNMTRAMHLDEATTKVVQPSAVLGTIRPELFILLGSETLADLESCLNGQNFKHGELASFEPVGVPLLLTYHPSELISQPLLKRQAWGHLQTVMRHLEVKVL